MTTGLNYNNIHLPEAVSAVLERDFWMLENVGPSMLTALTDDPIKFSATTWIIVRKGSCRGVINMVGYDIQAPTIVYVKNSHIMQASFISPDFEACVIVLSNSFREKLALLMGGSQLPAIATRHPVVPIPMEINSHFETFIKSMREMLSDKSNPFGAEALMHHIILFAYRHGYKCYRDVMEEIMPRQGWISNQFLTLVQENFRYKRFLDFYASKMELTPKYLSRTVKSQTGYTATEWIERYVVLEAKVLLKSSNLTIQQISDQLNFPSQSFFGKYFKKLTGMSPKEFRNS